MKCLRKTGLFSVLLAAALALRGQPALACAACFGKSDSSLALGMNWGIFVLLGFISMVLVGVAGVGVFFAKKARSVAAADAAQKPAVEPAPKEQP